MGDQSSIEWTDATWNPFTGCTKVSPGCDNCYMFRQYPRLHSMKVPGYDLAPDRPQMVLDNNRINQPSRWTKPRMIFVNSMSDTFHSSFHDLQIAAVFDAMMAAPQHTYQVLTKRPNRVRRWWEWYRRRNYIEQGMLDWPANIWLGTSVESAKYLPRIERITGIAPVTFLSAEPLLGPLIYSKPSDRTEFNLTENGDVYGDLSDDLWAGVLQWVIVGGESGPRSREMAPAWVIDIKNACGEWKVPFFFKQWGGATPKANGRLLNGRTYDEMPEVLNAAQA